MAAVLHEVCAFLENYWCRNQVLRTAQFSSALVGGLTETSHPELSLKMTTLYSSLGNMRIISRFLDDLPALAHTLKTWRSIKNMKDVSLTSKLAELLSVLCGLLYYPAEHMAWLVDNKLVPGKSTSLWTVAIMLWGTPLLISALQSTTALININQEMELLWRQEKSSNSIEKKVLFDQRQYVGRTPQMKVLMSRRFHIILSIIQSLSDLVNAVHWLPEGVLWSGKLPLFWVGLLGTLSSLIGLYKIVPGHGHAV